MYAYPYGMNNNMQQQLAQVEQNKTQVEHKNSDECVSKKEFDEVIGKLKKQIEVLKEGILYDAEHDTAND
jgi:hypothetical protein|nr:MAG TPA: hypothetical protein [Caudoviricetes sp.]